MRRRPKYRGETVVVSERKVLTKGTTRRHCFACYGDLAGKQAWRVAGKGDYLSTSECGFGCEYFCADGECYSPRRSHDAN